MHRKTRTKGMFYLPVVFQLFVVCPIWCFSESLLFSAFILFIILKSFHLHYFVTKVTCTYIRLYKESIRIAQIFFINQFRKF